MDGEFEHIHFTFDISDRTAEAIRLLVSPPIQTQLTKILKEIHKMAATEQEALDAIATLKGHVDALKAAIEAFIATNPGAAADFQSVLDAVAPVDTEVTDTTAEMPA